MKRQKEILLLALLIAALSVYLVFRRTEKVAYELPRLPEIKKEEVSRLVIEKGETALTLERQNERWRILPEGYAADSALVEAMVNTLVDLKLTALASEAESFSRYDLAQDQRILATAFNAETPLLRLEIGKTAPSFRHTFVKLADDGRVFHAAENFRSKFDKDVQALRDKQVMTVAEEISEVLLSAGGGSLHVVRRAEPPPAEAMQPPVVGEGPEAPPEPAPEPVEQPKWQTAEGKSVQEKELDAMMTTLASLKCDGFVEGKNKEDFRNPSFSVSLKGSRDYEFSVFDKQDGKFVCTSSESDHAFLIPEWRVNKIRLDLNSLVVDK